jgi:hypothetical protein
MIGAIGPWVQELQRQLYLGGCPPAMSTHPAYRKTNDPARREFWDGHFGPGTQEALMRFISMGGKLRPIKVGR